MDKVIVVKNDDGSVAVVHPAPAMFDINSRDRNELHAKGTLHINATDDQVYDFIILRSKLEGKSYRKAQLTALPTDRVFRNAWTDDNPTETVDIDLPKAKEIKKDYFRELRKPKLDALDVEFMRAVEVDDKRLQKEISDKKQALRDVTSLELPDDIEALKAFTPDILED